LKKKLKSNSQKKNWLSIRLGEILITSVGGTPATGRKDFWDEGDVPWINSGALKDTIISEPTTYITRLGLISSSAKVFPKNTVLIALTGATLGKIGLLDFRCSGNQSVTGIYPSKYLVPKFLFYYLLFIRKQFYEKAKGVAQPHINKETIDQTIIPIAPLRHQKRAVAFLENVFKQVSELKSKFKKIELLEDAAFRGYMQKGNKFYPQVPIGDYCSDRKERIGEAWKGKRLIGVSNESGITELRISGRKSFENYKVVHPGDFIYNPMRINIGSIALYDGQGLALTSPDYVVFTINHTLSKRLLLKYLKSDLGLEQINSNTRGSVRSRLYFSYLEKIGIPFCGVKCQAKAEMILINFEKMRNHSAEVLNNLQGTLNKSFKKFFSEKTYSKIKFDKDAASLIKLMKEEKKKNESFFKKSNKLNLEIMRTKPTSIDKPLIDMILKKFGGKQFTFADLHTVSKLSYDALKDQVFDLIDKSLALEFGKKEERMYLKLINHENPKN
jgi:type I restriction enzyme S subunit